MQVQTRHTPFYGVARVLLAPGEAGYVGAGSVLATSFGVGVTRAQGGLRKVLRTPAGAPAETTSVCMAPPQGGWVDVAPSLGGDLHVVELDGRTGWCVSRRSWLVAASTVRMDARWPGFQGLFGGEEGFLLHAAGQGPVVVCGFGALDVLSLQPGEVVTVDTGHLVAYAEGTQCRLRASSPGVAQSLRNGKGLVFDFAGPGQVLTQTRSPREVVDWLRAHGLVTRD